MLYGFCKAPKDLRMLFVKKAWYTKPKFVRSLAVGALAFAIGVGSLLMPEAHAYTADAFVMVVKTDNPGTSSATSFTIPITGTGYSYNVDCNDDGVNEVTARTTSYTCVYGAAGTKTIAITGTFPRIYFNNAGDREKLLEVKQWGTGAWTSMASAFYGCINMHVTATDAPNLAGVTNMSGMFREAVSFNENINSWNVSKVTDMSYTFAGYFDKLMTFNQPLDNWNTSAVTIMVRTFWCDTAFNQSLNSWDVSHVTNMEGMFASWVSIPMSFNQPLNNWNTGMVTNMRGMFLGAMTFNQPLDNWDTSKVTNMIELFRDAPSFNQPIGDWNTGAVTNMRWMFLDATTFNQPLNNWNTGAVTDMDSMFSSAAAFNQPLTNFDTSAVTNMSYMFYGASAFNQPLTNFNTSAVTNMSGMFWGAAAFNQPLTNFNTSAVTDMSWMFAFASAFNQPLTNFDTSAVTNMSYMFSSAAAFNQPLTNFNTSAVTNMYGMFNGATAFNQPLTNFNTSAVTNMSAMFSSAAAFNQPLTNFDTSAVTDMAGMFNRAAAFNQPLTNFNTGAVTNMNQMFYSAASFNQPLTGWDMAAVTDMSYMFDNSGYTTATYDQTLAHLASQTLHSNVQLGATGIPYCDDTAHEALTGTPNNWTINDTGFCPLTVASPTNLQLVSATPTVSGSALPNRTVQVVLDGVNYTTISQGDGTFNYPITTALSEGWHTVVIRLIGQSGTLGVPSNLSFYVHTGGSLALSGSLQTPTLSWNKAPGIPTGTVWQQTAQGATSFPARGSFGAASLNGKLWVVGGQGVGSGASSRLNDVWSSTDGITWTQTLAHAPWSARNAHTVTAFNGKLWVMGGQTTSSASRLNDVWSSPDGITWTQGLANAPWPARSAHEVLVHDNKLWLIGGADTTDADLRDVWNSPDGVNWTKVTDMVAWPSRRGFAAASFNGKLWVMGGLINNWGTYANDVWSSTDGITWTEETTDAAWPVRASHQVEVFDGKMWVLGGSADNWDSEYSDVWFSENGKDWIRTTEAADWTARRGHSTAVHDNKLWILGGRVGSTWNLSNDVWSAALPKATYTICWDTVENGCAQTAQTTNSSFTIPSNLAKGTWHFKVTANIPGTQGTANYTTAAYTVTDPLPVITPLTGKPVIHPVTGAASTVTLTPTLAEASLSVSSYDCSDVKAPTVRLVEPDGLKVAEANVTLLGGVGFSVGCTGTGKSADVALSFGAVYADTTKLRAYKGTGATLTDITDKVTFVTKDVSGTTRTVLSYSLTDGGAFDEDSTANSTIVDPIYIGVVQGASATAPVATAAAGGSLASTGVSVGVVAVGGVIMTGMSIAVLRNIRRRKYVSFRS